VEIILASTSPMRGTLMDALRVPYRAVAPEVDEQVPPHASVRDAVVLLARRKAEAIHSQFPEALVVGADQLVDLDGSRLEKPPDRDAARAQLRSLLGRSHDILAGVCVLAPRFSAEEVDLARVTFYAVSDAELERYLATEEWRGCAGGYRIEGAGQTLVERLDGDRTSVQGLPMIRLVRMLRAAGVTF
jgi:septum formation protein